MNTNMRSAGDRRAQLLWLRAALPLALAAIFSSAAASAAGRRMPAAYPDFDSALSVWNTYYKRSLVATSQGSGENVKLPIASAREAWYQVMARYYLTPPAGYDQDARWWADLATITGYHHLAEWLIAGGDLARAHEALEPIRRIWMALRERNGIRSFCDELTRYHDVMEPVVSRAAGGGVTPDNIEEFEAEVAALAKAWHRVTDFGFRPSKRTAQRRFGHCMGNETKAIQSLRGAVAARRYEEIEEAAREVKNAFTALYMGFG